MKYQPFLVGVLLACLSQTTVAMALLKSDEPPKPAIACPARVTANPLPCVREFSPVCALIKVGQRTKRMTYSSKCLACNSTKVVSYTQGPCR